MHYSKGVSTLQGMLTETEMETNEGNYHSLSANGISKRNKITSVSNTKNGTQVKYWNS